MPYYRTCPYCRANLDPGEICDCQDMRSTGEAHENGGIEQARNRRETARLNPEGTPNEPRANRDNMGFWDTRKKAALDATNTQSGKVESE